MQSEIRAMTLECAKVNGINMAQGICDTPVPQVVRRAAQDAIERGDNIYTRYDGREELRLAISSFYKRTYNLDLDPAKEIIVSSGATGALYSACCALLDPGDEVIVFEPYYGYHINTLKSRDLVPIYIRMEPPHWTIPFESLEAAITPRTRAIIINTPGNPSGKIFSREELMQIAVIVKQHDLFIFTDEIYEHFLFDGSKHISPLMLPEIREHVIGIGGLSKTFSITGWRIGYCLCDARWSRAIGYFSDLVYVCAPAPLQMGAAAGLNDLPSAFYHDLAATYELKRNRICQALTKAGLTPIVPNGSYYVLADVSSVPGSTAKERALYILNSTGVASVPGNAFYHDNGGENLVRFCFAKEWEILEDACKRIEKITPELNK